MIGPNHSHNHIENDKSKGIKMTESKSAELSREISSFLAIFRNTQSRQDQTETDETTTPSHIEQVDFDRLRQSLSETVVELDAASVREKETAFLRSWLINRIKSLHHARHVILSRGKFDERDAKLDLTTIPDLVNLFEEETAYLRGTVKIRSGKNQGFKAADDYRQFKS